MVKPMRQTFLALIAGVILTTFAVTAQAQFGPEGRYRPEKVTALIDHVHDDLNHGYTAWKLHPKDRERMDTAEHQLREFAEHWQHGAFDRGKLSSAIGAIQKVVEENRISGHERDDLWRDLDELRRMRDAFDHHEIGPR